MRSELDILMAIMDQVRRWNRIGLSIDETADNSLTEEELALAIDRGLITQALLNV